MCGSPLVEQEAKSDRSELGRALGPRPVDRCIDTDRGAHQRDARGHDQPGALLGELLTGSVSAASAPELQAAHRVRAVEHQLQARVSRGDLNGPARRAVDADDLSRHTTSMPISMGFSNPVRAGLRRWLQRRERTTSFGTVDAPHFTPPSGHVYQPFSSCENAKRGPCCCNRVSVWDSHHQMHETELLPGPGIRRSDGVNTHRERPPISYKWTGRRRTEQTHGTQQTRPRVPAHTPAPAGFRLQAWPVRPSRSTGAEPRGPQPRAGSARRAWSTSTGCGFAQWSARFPADARSPVCRALRPAAPSIRARVG